MLLERAEMIVREGMEEEFAAVMSDRAVPFLQAIDGASNVSVGRGIENANKFMLLVEWKDMDAHIAFTQMTVFGEFREMLMPYTTGGAMEHFNMA